ncbi:DUF3455 domain-containing protein [Actinoplanes sp. NPDC049599]|uniref:DUF3455 domain-containing protein n=1 Tax=Actinoplanes sp. NPDC049599 TaxID=3363903 RepID=UPI0037956604
MSSSRTRLRAVTVAAAATVVAAVSAVTYNASAAELTGGPRPRPSASPSPIDPPPGLRRIGAFRVVQGTQTYTCTGGVFTGASVPEAKLAGPGGLIHHFKGPSWQSERDGSLVTATKKADLPRPGTIPELLLEVTSHSGPANGLLAKATHIQRLNTSGGVAPAGACTDGATRAVRYGALYVFWG